MAVGTGAAGAHGAGEWKSDLADVLRLGWPNSVNMFLTFLPGLVMFYFLGDPSEIAGAGMGFMFCNVTGFSMIVAFGAGKEPLMSQAFGARNFMRCGDLLQRQIAIHAALMIPVGAIWLETEHLLTLFRQPASVSKLAASFVLWRVPALPALALKEDLTGFLTSQRLMMLPMVASVSASVVNMAGFAILIPVLGYAGAPLAYTVANMFQALMLFTLSPRVLLNAATWPAWSLRTAFRGWGELLGLALPGGALMLSEWWGWEINLFFAGLLCADTVNGCAELDAFPIVANTMVLGFMPNFGFSIAAGSLVGNALGASDPERARRLGNVAVAVAACVGGTVAVVLVALREYWGLLFTNDAEVVAVTARTLPAIAAYIMLDCMGPGALASVLRSASVVVLPAILSLVSFYVLGIPFGLMLTFWRTQEGWGILGLWIGLVFGMFFMVSSLLMLLWYRVSWRSLAEAAQCAAVEDGAASSGQKAIGKSCYDEVPTGDVPPETCAL